MSSKQQYDDCNFCGGRVSEKMVQKACWWGERLVALVDSVPAGVCEQCGERYYKASVLKSVENILKHQEFNNSAQIPMADYKVA